MNMAEGKAITLAHGSGGLGMHRLIDAVFRSRFSNPALDQGDDAARLGWDQGPMAFTTDAYVIKPLFFPGGDIGKLAVCGTANDLAVKGACPLYLSASFIIGENFPISDLERVADSMARTAKQAGMSIVTGDTKVVERQASDGLFITTSGLGRISLGIEVSGANLRPGDVIMVSGTVGDHGAAVMNARLGLGLGGELQSDVDLLWPLVERVLSRGGVRAMRDPTRGGLATTLNELAQQSQVRIEIEEDRVPVKPEVKAAAEMLGLEVLYLPCEGRMALAVDPSQAEGLLAAMREHYLGRQAAIIGRVDEGRGEVVLRTAVGTRRLLPMLEGEHLPRIC